MQSHRGCISQSHRGCYRSPIGAVSQSHRGCIAVPSGLYVGVCIGVSSRVNVSWQVKQPRHPKIELQLQLQLQPPTPNCNCNCNYHFSLNQKEQRMRISGWRMDHVAGCGLDYLKQLVRPNSLPADVSVQLQPTQVQLQPEEQAVSAMWAIWLALRTGLLTKAANLPRPSSIATTTQPS